MKFKDILKKQSVMIIIFAILANIVLNFMILKSFDFVSSIIYLFLGIIIASVYPLPRKSSASTFFVLAAVINLIYNGAGIFLGWFQISLLPLMFAAVQQGAVAWLISKLEGVN